MNIYLRELKVNLRSVLIWSISIAVLTFVTMSIFPSIASNAEAMEQLLKQMPEGLIKAFGMDKLNMNTILGYYATKAYLMVILLGSIFATLQGANILAKEEGDKTIEFLLSKPVTRPGIVTSKVLAMFTNVTVFNIIVTAFVYISFEAYKTESYSHKVFWLLALAPYLAELTFAFVGLLASMFIKKKRAVVSLGIGLVLTTYFFSIIADLKEDYNFLGYLSPFKYGSAVDVVVDERIKAVYLGIMAAVIVVCLALTYLVYNRKDITV